MRFLIHPASNDFRLLQALGAIGSVIGLLLLLGALVSLVLLLTGQHWPFMSWPVGLAFVGYGLPTLVVGQVLLWMVASWRQRRELPDPD